MIVVPMYQPMYKYTKGDTNDSGVYLSYWLETFK